MNEEEQEKLTKTAMALVISLLGGMLFLCLVISIAFAIIVKLVP